MQSGDDVDGHEVDPDPVKKDRCSKVVTFVAGHGGMCLNQMEP